MTLRILMAMIGAALSLGNQVIADDRPTPEAVFNAVAESRARFVQSQRPEEYLKIVQSKLEEARKRRIDVSKESNFAKRKKRIEMSRNEIETLEVELKLVKSRKGQRDLLPKHASGLPVLVERRVLEWDRPLMPLDWARLSIGQVGEVGICGYGNHAGEAIRCQHKLDAGAFLGCHTVLDDWGATERNKPARTIESPSVVFVGVDKADDGKDLQEGELSSITFTAVVTGTTQIEIPRIGSKTVFVVEKFDPDQPFK